MLWLRRALLALGLIAIGVGAGVWATHAFGDDARFWFERVRDKLARMRDSAEAEPLWLAEPGYRVAIASRGYSFPSRIAPNPVAPANDEATAYWVAELSGTIRAVSRTGSAFVLAEHLLDFERAALQESGLLGLDADATGSSLFLTLAYWDEAAGAYRNRVDRLRLSANGRSIAERSVVLDMSGEATVASYQIQFVRVAPDGTLFVGVGMGANPADAQDLGKFAGKILHLDTAGNALPGNPFFDPAQPRTARSYIYAFGFRNPFDLDFDPASGIAIVSDVGPGIDRILRLERGANYLFGQAGGESMMRANALFTWGPGGSFAPTGVALRRVPGARTSELFVALYGAVYDPGVNLGKRVLRFELDDRGFLSARGELAVHYGGKFFSSITDVANVNGEILFADLYGAGEAPHDGKGLVYRLERTARREAAGPAAPVTGEVLFASLGCNACHDVHDGDSTKEGPALGGLAARLGQRLAGAEYRARTERLARREGAYFAAQRALYAEIAALSGDARSERWFRAHLHDPRFDHPEGKMPAYAQLSEDQIAALAKFLLDD